MDLFVIIKLFFEFFLTGLLAVGGGLATLPFLYDISDRTNWFSHSDILNMIAVSESTPGPIGVNMATYVGYDIQGFLGALTATLGLVLPSFITIVIIAHFVDKYKSSPITEGTFAMLRPASTAMVTAAGISVAKLAFFPNGFDFTSFGGFFAAVDYKVLILSAVILAATLLWKKGHPIFFIIMGAVAGIVFKM